jgi:hypothetical protein
MIQRGLATGLWRAFANGRFFRLLYEVGCLDGKFAAVAGLRRAGALKIFSWVGRASAAANHDDLSGLSGARWG